MADPQNVKDRLHGALNRGGKKATEEEVAAVAEVVLLVVAELVTELTLVLADLEARVDALEAH